MVSEVLSSLFTNGRIHETFEQFPWPQVPDVVLCWRKNPKGDKSVVAGRVSGGLWRLTVPCGPC
eukprot:1845328-Heterocapsa_arctica.AAC.1